MKSVLATILLTFSICSIYSQSPKISKEALHNDLDVLVSTLDRLHPNMYFDIGKEGFEKKLEETKEHLTEEMDVFDYYKIINPLVTDLNDGHTALRFPVTAYREIESQLFPVSVKVSDQDLSVTVKSDYSVAGESIPKNAEITSINGIPTQEILREMLRYISGERVFYKQSRLSEYFAPLLYVLYRSDAYTINYTFKGTSESVKLEGLSYDEFYKRRNGNNDSAAKGPYSLELIDSVAIMDFRSFTDLKSFKEFLRTTFTTIKDQGISNLILDLRENGGGSSSLGIELFQYLSDKPFHQFEKAIIKSNDKLKEKEVKKLIKPRKNSLRFTGNIYVLQSNYTFSSASTFTWAFKHFEMGKIIGEEAGGMSITHGVFQTETLPNSGLGISVSTRKFTLVGASENDIHGTLPDYKVSAQVAMDVAFDLIRKESQN